MTANLWGKHSATDPNSASSGRAHWESACWQQQESQSPKGIGAGDKAGVGEGDEGRLYVLCSHHAHRPRGSTSGRLGIWALCALPSRVACPTGTDNASWRNAAAFTDLRSRATAPGLWLPTESSAAPAFNCELNLHTPAFILGKGQPHLQPSAALTKAAVSVVEPAFKCCWLLLLNKLFSSFRVSGLVMGTAAVDRMCLHLTAKLFSSASFSLAITFSCSLYFWWI